MTTQEKVVGMVQGEQGVGGKVLGFSKRVSEFFICNRNGGGVACGDKQLLLAQYHVHDPTSTHMAPKLAAMVEDVVVVTPGLI